jgi:hypothetical protein
LLPANSWNRLSALSLVKICNGVIIWVEGNAVESANGWQRFNGRLIFQAQPIPASEADVHYGICCTQVCEELKEDLRRHGKVGQEGSVGIWLGE